MRSVGFLSVAAFVVVTIACSRAEEVRSGIGVGGRVGTYKATKCGGADDGVPVGKSLCYT